MTIYSACLLQGHRLRHLFSSCPCTSAHSSSARNATFLIHSKGFPLIYQSMAWTPRQLGYLLFISPLHLNDRGSNSGLLSFFRHKYDLQICTILFVSVELVRDPSQVASFVFQNILVALSYSDYKWISQWGITAS